MSHKKTLCRVHVKTVFLQDTFVFRVDRKKTSGQRLLDQIRERHNKWHSFTVHGFVFDMEEKDVSKSLTELFQIGDLEETKEIRVSVVESSSSIARRKEEIRKMEEEQLRRKEEARLRAENRRRRIQELKFVGECWELDGYSNFIDVPLEENGKVVRNKGSLDQWCCVRYLHLIPESYNAFYFAVKIDKLPPTTNTWRICVGVVPVSFRPHADRHWIGAQQSWSYIAGTGGKCHNSGKSICFGQSYGEGDVIGVLVNFVHHTIEFFKNGVSQGIAFRNIRGPVYPAVSLTAKDSCVRLLDDPSYPSQIREQMEQNIAVEREKRRRWMTITDPNFQNLQATEWTEANENAWAPIFSYKRDEAMYYPQTGPQILSVQNQGSQDKWRVARTVGHYPNTGVQGFEVTIVNDTKSSNTWRICVGIVPLHFSSVNDRIWVGSQQSFGYIAGTGGKCHDCGQSTAYGERFTTDDRVAVVMNFDDGTLEFFKNDESQGIAFESLVGPFYGAVSMTADDAIVRLKSLSQQKLKALVQQGKDHRSKVCDVATKFGNVWEPNQSTPSITFDKDNLLAVRLPPLSDGQWATVVSFAAYQSGRRYFEIQLDRQTNGNEKLKFSVGVVGKLFNVHGDLCHVGSSHSWAYVSDGTKCSNASSSRYGSKFGPGDRIGVLMDFDNQILEFFKNGSPQGEAFNDLCGPVFAAVSSIGLGASAEIDGKVEDIKTSELFLFK